MKVRTVFEQLWRDEAGQDLTEYALLLVLLSLAAVSTMGTLASAIQNAFSNSAANLSNAT